MTNNDNGTVTVSANIQGTERYCTSRFAVGDQVRITKNDWRKGQVVTVRSINGSFGHGASATFTYVCDPYHGVAYAQRDLAPVDGEGA